MRGDRIPTIPTSQLGSSELLSSVQSQQGSVGILPAIPGIGGIGGIGIGGMGAPMSMIGGGDGGIGPVDTGLAVLPGIDTSLIVPSESEEMETEDPFA